MTLSIEEVRKIAQLARIELTPEELARHAETMSAVLDYMNILNEVDTTGVEPTFQVTGLENVYRDDEVVECKLRDRLLKQMPEVEMEELFVPGVFD